MRRTSLLLASAAVALLLALGVGLLGAGEPARAAFPGVPGKVFFGHDGDVWTMNADGSGATKLTTNYNAEGNPAVSPDGSRVAYEFLRGIWVMNADGSAKKMLTDGATTDQDPAWSADGTRIAFSRGGDVWVMNANGLAQTNLTNTPGNEEYDPAFSPAGGTIAYTRTGSIWAMNPDGSAQTNLTPEDELLPQCPDSPGYYFNGASKHPAFSPDGQKIAFTGPVICPNNMGSNIWVMNADGSGKTNLINDNGTSDIRPAFSPDGTRIVFESNRDGVGSPTELYSMSAGVAGMTRLTNNTVWDSDADWAALDVTAPRVTAVAPAAGAVGVSPRANVSAAFSEAMRANTLTKTTVRLVSRGTTRPVNAAVAYNPDTMRVTLDPASNLSSGEAYTATITTGAKDAAGNALPAKTWSFKVL